MDEKKSIKKEQTYEEFKSKAMIIAKGLYNRGGSGSGRSLKPTNHETLALTFLRAKFGIMQKNGLMSKPKPIATLGLFERIPKPIAEKIHDKNERNKLTLDDLSVVAKIILESMTDVKLSDRCLVHLTEEGFKILKSLLEKKNLDNLKIDITSIFVTQERQLIFNK